MPHRSDSLDLSEIEARLHAKKADLEERLGRFTAAPERGANLSFGKRIGDGTSEAVDRLNQIGVGNSLVARHERVNRALHKLAAGTYGACDVCGEPIDPRRLNAAPESVTCVSCPSSRVTRQVTRD
jgi:RNA polymerase-binding transcription factor